LKGTLDNTTFVKTPDGFYAKLKRSFNKSKYLTDPAFERQRDNVAEFTRAIKGGKLIRSAMRPLIIHAKDRKSSNRLSAELKKIVLTDTVSERGKRNLDLANTDLLKHFEFNGQALLDEKFYAPIQPSIDRATGSLTIDIPSFIPKDMIVAPEGTTHFEFISAGLEANFEGEMTVFDMQKSALLPWDNNATAVINLTHNVSANSKFTLMLSFGIRFYQQVNGYTYPMKDASSNPLKVVDVLKP
jgi:hypothetical protein